MRMARRVSTPVICLRNSAVPRMSSIGVAASSSRVARLARSRRSSSFLPISDSAAALVAKIGVGPTAPSAIRAAFTSSPSRVTDAPTPDHRDIHFVARDEAQICVRRMRLRRRNQQFDHHFARLQHGAAGRKDEILDRDFAVAFRPAMRASAPSAISAGVVSAAGEPLHRLPPTDARFWICSEPMRCAASVKPG